jgi:hypothetical protein
MSGLSDAINVAHIGLYSAARNAVAGAAVLGERAPAASSQGSPQLDPAVRTTWAGFSVGGAAAPWF